ncbi:MAG: type II secretion system major pseudopilin GspG [Planctomycetota bacterium]
MKRNALSIRRQGLTLLELMIVLIILVGLIAMVGPRLLGTQKKADIRTAQVQIGNLVSALKSYAVDMKSFPLTEEGLEALVTAPEDEAIAKNWDGPYLEGGKLPKDPWGSDFQYEYEAAEASDNKSEASDDFPRIVSLGPDRQPNTSDDISNKASDKEESDDSSSKRSSK